MGGVRTGVRPNLILCLFPKALKGEINRHFNKFTNCFNLGLVAVTSADKEIIQVVPKEV